MPDTLKNLIAITCLFLTCAPTLVLAQNMDTQIVSGQRIAGSVQGFNGSLYSQNFDVPSQDFQQHLAEVLNRAPGMNIQRGEGQEYLPALRSAVLTGTGACGSLLSMQDGIALRANGFCNINELFDASSETASRAEIIRGPGNALYGSNALHGVVNLITPALSGEQPNQLGLLLADQDYAQLRLQYGETDEFGLNLVLSHDGGYRDQSGFDQQKLDIYQIQQFAHWTATHSISLMNLNQETAGYAVGLDAYKDEQLSRANPNPEAFRDPWAIRVYSRWEQSASGLLFTPYLRLNSMDFLQHFLPGTPLEQNGHFSLGLQSQQTLTFADVDLTYGLDLEYTQGWLRQSQDQPTQGSPFIVATVPDGKHYDYEVTATQWAPFAQTIWHLRESLDLHAGLRFEQMQYDYDNRMLAGRTRDDGTACGFGGCRYSRPADRSDSFDNLGSNLGLNWNASSNDLVFVRIAQAYRAPQTSELYRLRGAQSVADIHSESLSSVELGWRRSIENWSAELAMYRMVKSDVIFRDSSDFYVSDGRTSHQGAELSLSWQIDTHWAFDLVANQGDHRYRATFDSTGANLKNNRIESAPELFGSARLTWQQASDYVQLEWVHRGDFYLDAENRFTYPGHNLLNLIYQRSTDWGSVSLSLSNLTDEAYADRADFTAFTGPRYFPGERRQLMLKISRDFD